MMLGLAWPLLVSMTVHTGEASMVQQAPVQAVDAVVSADAPTMATRFAAWFGRWSGAASVKSPSRTLQQFEMELNIAATADSDRLSWELVYITTTDGGQQRQVRPYELVAVNAEQGRYQVDEKNGIVIPTVLVDGVLHATFIVQGNQISVSYRLQDAPADEQALGPRLIVEMITTDTTRPSTTGDRDSAPPVITLPTRSVQRAELRRRRD